MSAQPPKTILALWKRSSIGIALEFRGATCPSALAAGRTRIGGSAAGPKTEFSSACSNAWAPDANNEYVMIDSTIVRAHQHSAGAPLKDEDQAIGRSRGVLSTKIHILVDALGNGSSSGRSAVF